MRSAPDYTVRPTALDALTPEAPSVEGANVSPAPRADRQFIDATKSFRVPNSVAAEF